MTKSRSDPPKAPETPEIVDEPGAAERFQRVLRNLLNTPPKPRGKRPLEEKERPAGKGQGHKGRSRI